MKKARELGEDRKIIQCSWERNVWMGFELKKAKTGGVYNLWQTFNHVQPSEGVLFPQPHWAAVLVFNHFYCEEFSVSNPWCNVQWLCLTSIHLWEKYGALFSITPFRWLKAAAISPLILLFSPAFSASLLPSCAPVPSWVHGPPLSVFTTSFFCGERQILFAQGLQRVKRKISSINGEIIVISEIQVFSLLLC